MMMRFAFVLLFFSVLVGFCINAASRESLLKKTVESHVSSMSKLKQCGFDPENILDVGAGDGSWSRAMHSVFPESRYFLIEGDKKHSQALSSLSSSKYNGMKSDFQIAVVSRAASDNVSFYRNHDGSNSLSAHAKGARSAEVVSSTTIDAILSVRHSSGSNGDDDVYQLAKFDLHGGERLALKGAAIVTEKAEVIIVEALIMSHFPNVTPYFLLMEYLRAIDFHLFDIIDVNRDKNKFLSSMDMIFVKNNSPLWKEDCTGYPSPFYLTLSKRTARKPKPISLQGTDSEIVEQLTLSGDKRDARPDNRGAAAAAGGEVWTQTQRVITPVERASAGADDSVDSKDINTRGSSKRKRRQSSGNVVQK